MDNIDDLLNLMRVEQQNRIYAENHEDFDDYIEKTEGDICLNIIKNTTSKTESI